VDDYKQYIIHACIHAFIHGIHIPCICIHAHMHAIYKCHGWMHVCMHAMYESMNAYMYAIYEKCFYTHLNAPLGNTALHIMLGRECLYMQGRRLHRCGEWLYVAHDRNMCVSPLVGCIHNLALTDSPALVLDYIWSCLWLYLWFACLSLMCSL